MFCARILIVELCLVNPPTLTIIYCQKQSGPFKIFALREYIIIVYFLAPLELLKWRCQSVCLLVGLSVSFNFLAAYSACSGSFWPSLVWSRLVQTNLVYCSQIQSNIVKSSQIQKNLFQAISGSIQRMWRLFIVQSGLDQTSKDQFSPLQSNLVKSSHIQRNLFLR